MKASLLQQLWGSSRTDSVLYPWLAISLGKDKLCIQRKGWASVASTTRLVPLRPQMGYGTRDHEYK